MRYRKKEIPMIFSEKPAFISLKRGKGWILMEEKQGGSQAFSQQSQEDGKLIEGIFLTAFVTIRKA